MKFKHFAYTVLLLAFWISGFCIGLGFCGKIEQAQTKDRLPTIEEIQERIGAVPDGILGPETQKLWELALCDQYAAQWMDGVAKR